MHYWFFSRELPVLARFILNFFVYLLNFIIKGFGNGVWGKSGKGDKFVGRRSLICFPKSPGSKN